ENHVFHDVTVSRKTGDKGTNKLVSQGRLSVYDRAGNLQRHGFGVVGQNPVLIGSTPCLKILVDECPDVVNGSDHGRKSHSSPPEPDILAQPAVRCTTSLPHHPFI